MKNRTPRKSPVTVTAEAIERAEAAAAASAFAAREWAGEAIKAAAAERALPVTATEAERTEAAAFALRMADAYEAARLTAQHYRIAAAELARRA